MNNDQMTMELIRNMRKKRHEKTVIYKAISIITKGTNSQDSALSPQHDNNKGEK